MRVLVILIFVLTIFATYVAEAVSFHCENGTAISQSVAAPQIPSNAHQEDTHTDCNINHCHLGHCGLIFNNSSQKIYVTEQLLNLETQTAISSNFIQDLFRPPIC